MQKIGLLDQYFKVAQEYTFLPMLYNGVALYSILLRCVTVTVVLLLCYCFVVLHTVVLRYWPNTAQWAVVIGFVGVRFPPRTGFSPSDGGSSQRTVPLTVSDRAPL